MHKAILDRDLIAYFTHNTFAPATTINVELNSAATDINIVNLGASSIFVVINGDEANPIEALPGLAARPPFNRTLVNAIKIYGYTGNEFACEAVG